MKLNFMQNKMETNAIHRGNKPGMGFYTQGQLTLPINKRTSYKENTRLEITFSSSAQNKNLTISLFLIFN